jgi:hypothetical protein
MTVFGVDCRGAALACDEEGFVFLGPDGIALAVGRTLDDVVHRFLLGGLTRTYELTRGWPTGRAWTDAGIELGCEDVWVTSLAPGMKEYLADLATRGEGDLSLVLGREPVLLAYLHTAAALCSADADVIAADVRSDALDTVLMLARRRVTTATLIPAMVKDGDAFKDPNVRSWAETRPTLGPRGPFGTPLELVAPSPITLGRPWHLQAHWPRVVPAMWAEAIVARCKDTALGGFALEQQDAFHGLAEHARVGLTRQVTQLDDDAAVFTGDGDGRVLPDDSRTRADDAEARASEWGAEMSPALVLAILGGPSCVSVRATRALSRKAPSEVWLRLLAGTCAPMPWGADSFTFAELAIAHAPLSDTLTSVLLPALREKSLIAALLLSSRADRADVRDALLDSYGAVALASAWSGEWRPDTLLSETDERTRAVLAAHLGMDGALPPLEIGEGHALLPPALRARWQPGSWTLPRPFVNPRLTPPFRPAPLGPVTSALVRAAKGSRCGAVLARVASDTKVDLPTRDEALKGLVALDAPGTDELAVSVQKAWERYWKI